MKFRPYIYILLLLSITFNSSYAQTTIAMQKRGNVYYIPGKINGLPLEFIFDTGASNVYLSLTEALFMIKHGYLTNSDVKGSSVSQIANGDIVENIDITLRELEIGGIVLKNISASISQTLEAPILLGQSALEKLGPIQIDGEQLIILNGKSTSLTQREAEILLSTAYQCAEAGEYAKAIKLSEDALKLVSDPETRSALYDNMAYAYFHSGNPSKAIEMENNAIAMNIKNRQATYNLAYYYFRNHEYTKSLQAIHHYFDRFSTPKDEMYIDALLCQGEVLHLLGRIKESEDTYTQCLKVKESSQAYFGLADIYYETERFGQAAQAYKSGISYEPNRMSNIKRYYQLGTSYMYAGNKEQAKNAFKQCLRTLMANKIPEMLTNTSDVEIQELLQGFITTTIHAEIWLARLAETAPEAITRYTRIIHSEDVDKLLNHKDFFQLAAAYYHIGDEQKAEQTIKLCYERYNNEPDAIFQYSLILDDKDPDRIDLLHKLIEMESSGKEHATFDYATVYNNLAWTYYCLEDPKKALPYAEIAIKKNPTNGYSWETIGEIYYKLERYHDCIEAMTKCLECEDQQQHKAAYAYRGKAYLKIGQKHNGDRDIRKSKELK